MMNFKNLVVATLTVCSFVGSAFAGPFTKKSELGGFDGFVERMSGGVRELGRGNTGSADTASMPGAFWNPALVGKRMGVGFAMLYRGDRDFKVIDDDDETVGTAKPFFSMFYLGFAYRATRQDAFGLSLSMSYDNLDVAEHLNEMYGIDAEDSFRSPVTINLSWFRQWNEKWSSSVVIRNLSFSKNLSARWTKNPSKDNSLASTEGVRPKVLQIGLGYRSRIMGKPVYAWMEALDYQVADTLLAFDPQLHVWTGRVGFECEVVPNATLRVGMDDLNWMLGAGYKFELNIGRKKYPLEINYAFLYETSAGLWSPFTLGLRGYIP